MNGNYLDNYGPLLLMFILAAGLAGALITLSTIVGRHKRTREKDMPYECGIPPTGDARQPFAVHYYIPRCFSSCLISKRFFCIPGRSFIRVI